MKIIGAGGHAKVVRDLIKAARLEPDRALAFVAVGNNRDRRQEATIAQAAGYSFPTLIHPGACVDHDCVIEAYAHIAPGVALCGNVFVGEGALVGVGACAVPGARIEAWSLVRAGRTVR